MPKALSFLISHPISLWHDDLLFLKPPFIHLPHSLSIYKPCAESSLHEDKASLLLPQYNRHRAAIEESHKIINPCLSWSKSYIPLLDDEDSPKRPNMTVKIADIEDWL
jgi:hypothetical protein